MGLPEIAEFARNFAVMVRLHGPDPKGLKMREHAFHQYNSGKTTISASGMVLPESLYDVAAAKRLFGDGDSENFGLVVTVASVIDPFLSVRSKGTVSQGRPELIPGAQIDVMVEDRLMSGADSKNLSQRGPNWVSAQLLKLVDVPISSLAFQSLIEASVGPTEHGWEAGWSLASYGNGRPSTMDVLPTQIEHGDKSLVGRSRHPSLMGNSSTRMAILGVSISAKDIANITVSSLNNRGDFVLAVGSPFGVLSPLHFFGSISVGFIANFYPPHADNRSLLMADIRCLPGMEGGPVFGESADLLGILIRPLRQKVSGAEIQLVIPWGAIATACCDLLHKEPQYANQEIHTIYDGQSPDKILTYKCPGPCYPEQLPVEKAVASVSLVTIDDSVWASGVLLNKGGLILTNAHLLEPWRFGKNSVHSGKNDVKSEASVLPREDLEFLKHENVGGKQKSEGLFYKAPTTVDSSVGSEHGAHSWNYSYHSLRNIRVRLDHLNPSVWFDARVVYICKGPLDVALLKLEHVPDQLTPMVMDLSSPSVGSKAYIIGHGLFGPKSGFLPSVCSGVVAKVVKAEMPPPYQSILNGDEWGQFPAMIETTAAVHPGGSGGAVVNSDGHMIGLVTSNARHGGGTVIPHLNFSIPCAALAPILKFSRDMQDVSVLQELDQSNEQLSSVWTLMPPLSPKPGPGLPTLPQSLLLDDNKEGRGSKFAKFIAERQIILEKSSPLGKAERLPNEMIHSKL